MKPAALEAAVRANIERFDEGPPIDGFEEAEAIRRLREALISNAPMFVGADADSPDGEIL